MSRFSRVSVSISSWRLAAALVAATAMLLLLPASRAQAVTVTTFTLTDPAAGANTAGTLNFQPDAPLNPGDTITLTFPAGWQVQNGALITTNYGGLVLPPASVVGSSGAQTVTITLAAPQLAIPTSLTIAASAEVKNQASAGAGLTLDVAATGQAPGTSAPFAVTAGGGGAITGGAVTLTSTVAGANTAGTIAFTLPGTVTTGDSIVLTFPAGWTVADGALTVGNWTGLNGAPASVTGASGARTVTIVIGATAQTSTNVTLSIAGSAQLVNPTTAAGGLTINVAATGQTAANTNTFAITAGVPSQIALTGPGTVAANAASTNFTITVRDAFGNTANTTQNTTFTLASNTAGVATFNPVSPVTVSTGTSSVTFTYTDSMAGVGKTITATRASGDAIALPATANITVTGGLSSNADLSALTISVGTLAPGFAAGTITYTAAVGNGTASIDVTATRADAGASITIGGNPATSSVAMTVALAVGGNPIAVVVTAADTTVKTYTVTVTRAGAAPPPDPPSDGGGGGGGGGIVPVLTPTVVQCAPGTFSATGNTPCDPAPAGTFVSTAGAIEPMTCPQGTSSAAGAVVCVVLPTLSVFAPIGGGSRWDTVPAFDPQVTDYAAWLPYGDSQNQALLRVFSNTPGTTVSLTTPAGTLSGGDGISVTLTGPETVVTATPARDGVRGKTYTLTLKKVTAQFSTQPGGAAPEQPFATQPTVTVRRSDGTVATDFTGVVNATLENTGTVGAKLAGSTSATAVAGVATFQGLSIDSAGTGYVLTASWLREPSGATIGRVSSNPFDVSQCINGGTPTSSGGCACPTGFSGPTCATANLVRLTFSGVPVAASVGQAFAIEVTAVDANGQPISNFNQPITLGLQQAKTVRSTDLSYTPVQMIGGVARFTDVRVARATAGADFFLFASAGSALGRSGEFSARVGPTKLAFGTQPAGAAPGVAFTRQPVVRVLDGEGNLVTSATSTITLTIKSGTGATGAKLISTSATAVGGIAKFSGVQIDLAGSNYVLTASTTGLTSADSAKLAVTAPRPTMKLAFKETGAATIGAPRKTVKEGERFNLVVASQDLQGKATKTSGEVTLSAVTSSRSDASLGVLTQTLVDGQAGFVGLSFTVPGTYTVSANSPGLAPATIVVTVNADPAAGSLVFHNPPSFEVTAVQLSSAPSVTLIDSRGQMMFVSPTVTLTLAKQDGSATASTLATSRLAPLSVTMTFGTAGFDRVQVNGPDVNLVLIATTTIDGKIMTVTSAPFNVYETPTLASTARIAFEALKVEVTTQKFETKFAMDVNSVLTTTKKPLVLCSATVTTDCTPAPVTTSSVIARSADSVIATSAVEAASDAVTLGTVHLGAFEVTYGKARAGTGVLSAYALSARDARGSQLFRPAGGSLPLVFGVAAGAVPSDTPVGDLKMAAWDNTAKRWVTIPARVIANADGSFRIETSVDFFGVLGVLYAPGAGAIGSVAGFSASGVGMGVFAGGTVDGLAHAAGLHEADGVWVQDTDGMFQLLLTSGPAFLKEDFANHFSDEIPASTAVALLQRRT